MAGDVEKSTGDNWAGGWDECEGGKEGSTGGEMERGEEEEEGGKGGMLHFLVMANERARLQEQAEGWREMEERGRNQESGGTDVQVKDELMAPFLHFFPPFDEVEKDGGL